MLKIIAQLSKMWLKIIDLPEIKQFISDTKKANIAQDRIQRIRAFML